MSRSYGFHLEISSDFVTSCRFTIVLWNDGVVQLDMSALGPKLDTRVFKKHNVDDIKTLKCEDLDNLKTVDLLHPPFYASNHF